VAQRSKNIGRRVATATLTSRTNICLSSWRTMRNWSQFGSCIPAERCWPENWRRNWYPSCRNWSRSTRSDARQLPTMSSWNIWNHGNWILVFNSRLWLYGYMLRFTLICYYWLCGSLLFSLFVFNNGLHCRVRRGLLSVEICMGTDGVGWNPAGMGTVVVGVSRGWNSLLREIRGVRLENVQPYGF